MHEVRLIGLYEASSDGDFPDLSRGMMVAFLHTCGISALRRDTLKI